MYCDNCGCELDENAEKCPVCGKEFERNPVQDNGELTANEQENQNWTSAQSEENVNDLQGGQDEDQDDESTTVLTNPYMPGMNGQMPQMGPVPGMNVQMPDMGQNPSQPEQDIMIKKKGEKKPLGKGIKITLITVPIVIVIAIGVLAFLFVPKFKNYNTANEKLENGDIEAAVELYKDLGDFKDSYSLANGEAYYQYAEELEKDGNYMEAATYYTKAAKSKEAAKFDNADAQSKASQCYYSAGMEQMNAGSYDDAIEAFKNAGMYSDAADKVTECTYKKAQTLIASKKYDEAIELLDTIKDYSDAESLLSQCYYSKATELMEAASYDEAYEMFMKSEYDDYKKKANESIYNKAKELYEKKDYKNALECYGKVDKDYSDCVKEKDSCYIAMAADSLENKEYKQAIDYYGSVEKEDVSKKVVEAKLAFVNANKTAANTDTMTYLGELRYAGNSDAEKIYSELVKWDISSFVNNSETDLDNQQSTIEGKGEIYIHTSYSIDNDDSMTLSGYVVYADGNTSDSIKFTDPAVDGWSTWIKIAGDSAPKGTTYLYLTNEATKDIVEVYPFTIK